MVRKQSLEVADLASETSSVGGQNLPKSTISWRCGGDEQRGCLEERVSLMPACRKRLGMCRGWEGSLGRCGSGTTLALVLLPWAPSLLQLCLEKHRVNVADCKRR